MTSKERSEATDKGWVTRSRAIRTQSNVPQNSRTFSSTRHTPADISCSRVVLVMDHKGLRWGIPSHQDPFTG
jgi:hypothetical protein